MAEFWLLILVLLFAKNSLDKSESVQLDELEEMQLQPFDELFVEEWWDKDEAEDLKTPPPTNFGQNVHHQIDRQNTQLGQIEPNSTDQLGKIEPSTDQLGQIELNATDQLGQIEPNSTDQNPPLTESNHYGQIELNSTYQNPPLAESNHYGQIKPNSTDQNAPLTESDHSGQIDPNSTDQNPPLTESNHSDNAKNSKEQNEITSNNRKIVDQFHAIKDKFKQKGKYSTKEWILIEEKIAKHLKVNRSKIFEWKKEFGLSQKFYEKKERKHLVEKFDQRKAELQQGGIKNSQNELDKTVAKELGLSDRTISRWKSELGQTAPQHKHSHSEQKELMKLYYQIKDKTPKIKDGDIVKMLNIGRSSLVRWKKQFKRQKLHQNSVDGHSVDAGSNIQEIDNSNSGSI